MEHCICPPPGGRGQPPAAAPGARARGLPDTPGDRQLARRRSPMSGAQEFPAPGKLNLMLRVTGRRADGYHLLQTVIRFIDRGDALSFRVREDDTVTRTNGVAGIPPDEDLAVRAARLLQRVTATRLGAEITLEKRLPVGGGLGGGSSDAATTLLALNHLWKTGLTRQRLQALAVELGADVPVFVY